MLSIAEFRADTSKLAPPNTSIPDKSTPLFTLLSSLSSPSDTANFKSELSTIVFKNDTVSITSRSSSLSPKSVHLVRPSI